MILNRRALLTAATSLVAWPALAEDAPPVLVGYERETGGRIGIYGENVARGTRLAWRAEERFVMCSTFKASLAALVLSRADHGQEHLESMLRYGPQDLQPYAPVARQHFAQSTRSGAMSVLDMCQAAVELSDNTCANLLLARVGGPAALTAFWRRTGDVLTRLDHDEPLLNRSPPGDPRDTTSPFAMAGNLRRLLLGDVLSPTSRARLADWMVSCRTGTNRLRAGLPTDWRIGDKTGNNGADAFGDIAVAWPKPDAPILLCVYTQGGSPTASQVTAVFTEIGRIAAERLG